MNHATANSTTQVSQNIAGSVLRQRAFGLVISDWMMEPMSGLELLRQVRADPKLQALPFIMITAENRKERVAQAQQAGADGFIVKPFNAEALSDRIAAVMAR
jgi:two-component system, chemotaxis family, chemotaxis protein CheY